MYMVHSKLKFFSKENRNRQGTKEYPSTGLSTKLSSYYVCPHCTVTLHFVIRKNDVFGHEKTISLLYFCSLCGSNFFVDIEKGLETYIMFEIKFDDDTFEFDNENKFIYYMLFKKYIRPVIYVKEWGSGEEIRIPNTNINDVFDCGRLAQEKTPEQIVFGDD